MSINDEAFAVLQLKIAFNWATWNEVVRVQLLEQLVFFSNCLLLLCSFLYHLSLDFLRILNCFFLIYRDGNPQANVLLSFRIFSNMFLSEEGAALTLRHREKVIMSSKLCQ